MVADAKQARQGKKQAKKENIGSSIDDSDGPSRSVPEVEDEILRRGNLCFASWYAKTLRDVLLYFDQQVDQALIMKMPHEGLQQLLEYWFDLRLKGNKDRVRTPNKRELFTNMRRVYEHLGSRLRFVIVDRENGMPDWECMELFIVDQQNGTSGEISYKPLTTSVCTRIVVVEAQL